MSNDKLDKLHAWEMIKLVKEVVTKQRDTEAENDPMTEDSETDDLIKEQKLRNKLQQK